MRRAAFLLIGFVMLASPGVAVAQSDLPPPVVESLQSPQTRTNYRPWLGATAGAAAAIVGVNAWTGGALLAPVLGPALSGLAGGSWLGLSALTPLGAQAFFQTTTVFAAGVAGGLFGHWLGSR